VIDSQPLLVSSREDLLSTRASPSPSASSSTDNVLFAIDDDDADDNDEQETSALDGPPHPSRRGKADQAVRFQEHVQVIAPPLRSTLESREAGTSSRALRLALVIDKGDPTWRFLSAFDLDSDELDHDGVGQANLERGAQRSREQSMPLLVGLLDASTVRRSLDIPLGVDGESTYSDIDLEELAAKQAGGGGMLNSIANMANSILGAGVWPPIFHLL
jgi:sodium-coupled neutral amino acid transporter 11